MKNTIHKTVGNFLKEKRHALGLTQDAVALELFGLKVVDLPNGKKKTISKRGRISAIENGRRGITLETLSQFLDFYKVEISFKEH